MARKQGGAGRSRDDDPLGSISQPQAPPALGTEACLRCGERELTRIRMMLPGERPAVFVSCPSCEQTNWFLVHGDGSPLSRWEVLGGE